MAVIVEPSHEDDAVNAHPPFFGQHMARLAEEGGRGDFGFAGAFGFEELVGLRETDADETDGDGEAGGDPEDRLPGLGGAADAQVGASGEDVAERVALLQDAGHEASGVDGAILQGHGDGVTVDATHKQAEETPDGEELLEGGAVDGGDLEQAEHDHVDDHGPFATELVTGKAEEGSADGAQEQGQSDGGRNIRLGGLVVFGELDGLDGQGVEVKSVGGPGEQADDEEDPIFGGQLDEELDGVLQGLGGLPFGGDLAIFVGDGDSLAPAKKVAEGLLDGWNGPFGYRLCIGIGGHLASRVPRLSWEAQRKRWRGGAS